MADQTCRVTVCTHSTSTLLSPGWAPLLMLSQLYTWYSPLFESQGVNFQRAGLQDTDQIPLMQMKGVRLLFMRAARLLEQLTICVSTAFSDISSSLGPFFKLFIYLFIFKLRLLLLVVINWPYRSLFYDVFCTIML